MKKEFGMGGVASVFEKVKKTVQEKWEGFKKKFASAKSEMSQEVLSAKNPDDMIATGKKLQEQGEVLKAEEDGVKQEEKEEAHGEANIENANFDERKAKEKAESEQGEAIEMNKDFDKAKVAEEKAREKAELAEEARLSDEADAIKAAELLEKIKSGKVESASVENIKDLEAELATVSKEMQSLAKIFNQKEWDKKWEKKQRELNREYGSKNKELLDKLAKVSSSWENVKSRALALGLVTVLAVDLPVVYGILTGQSGDTIMDVAMVAAAVAVNVIGYNVNKLIHSFKESVLINEREEKVNKPRRTEVDDFFAEESAARMSKYN